MGGFIEMKARSEAELCRIKSSWNMTDDGVLVWINGRNAGKNVCVTTLKSNHQNCYISFEGKLIGYSVGQVAWFLYHDEWPNLEVDHIDCNPKNHRKDNLRLATRQEQCINRKAGKQNRSNKGVYKRDYGNKWMAQIWVNGKCKCLGTFDSEDKAVNARIEAMKTMHGNYANMQSYKEAA